MVAYETVKTFHIIYIKPSKYLLTIAFFVLMMLENEYVI